MPRILFSHVPFERRANEHLCDVPSRSAVHGVRRESQRARVPGGDILQGGDLERTYQNLVHINVSDYVLDTIQPAVIFSGDDHDHCEAIHRGYRKNASGTVVTGFQATDIPELTVKSMSMVEGVKRPGYAWLQLQLNGDVPSVDYTPCLLPNQIALWLQVYLPLFVLTLAFVLFAPAFIRSNQSLLPIHQNQLPTKRRNLNLFVRTSSMGAFLRRLGRDIGHIAIFPLLLWLFLQR